MRRVWGVVLLLGCAAVVYQGIQNTRTPHPADARAEAIACDELAVCDGSAATWHRMDLSPFARTYEIDAGRGAVTITCRWSALLVGALSCSAEREGLEPLDPGTAKRRPHELGRGTPSR